MSAQVSSILIRGRAGLAVNKPTEPVPPGWVWVPVNSVARQETGHTPSRSHPEWWGGDIPWIGIRDARLHHGGVIYDTLQTTNPLGLANSSARLLPKGTVCLSRTASVGYVTVMGRDMATSQDFVTWTCSEALVPEFLVKALIAEGEGLRKFGKGTTHTTIYFPEIRALHICLPPLAEQKRIVAKLDALNAKSARARTELARIETLVSRYKQALLSKAFSGELTTSQRSIPASRVEVRDVLSELSQGWSPKCEKISASSDEQWAVITTTAIQSFVFKPDENKILPADLSPREHLVIEEGDVLITRAGPRVRCGVCCYVDRTRPRLMLCDKAYRLRLNDLFDPKFFVFLMNSPELLSRIEDMKTGGNDSGLNLTQERFTSLVVPMWPLDVQHEIVRRIESAFAKIDRLAKEAKRALELVARLDEAILAKAFRGELVPQDENDEPAEHLLARIRAEREAAPKGKRGRGARG